MTRALFAGCALAIVAFVTPGSSHSASEAVLYSFCSQTSCTDGDGPYATLVADASGNLYGTTEIGGANNDGEVFELAVDGTLTVLHSFAGSDGVLPHAGVIMDANGNLYGTTAEGGTTGGSCGSEGCGTVFKLAPDGTFSTLYAFSGADGSEPFTGLLLDGSGNLYGTTAIGGSGNSGTVFEIAPDGEQIMLYSFCDDSSCGLSPEAPVIMDSHANLYGTTTLGGPGICDLGCGTVFKLSARGDETTLYSFAGGTDGAYPQSPVTFGPNKTLLGTTSANGARDDGTVFKLRSTSFFHVLHEFHGKGDAQLPSGGLIGDGNGGYYGTGCAGGTGKHGAVFHIAANGDESIVYSFSGRGDGDCPASNLLDVGGTLYGTTLFGGSEAACPELYGCGTVFAIEEQSRGNN